MRKFEPKKLKDARIQQYTQQIKDIYSEQGITGELLETMVKLREVFIELEQPSIVKSIRLAYEHIEKYGDYVIPYWGNDSLGEDDEEEDEAPVVDPANLGSSFLYLIDLFANPANKYNRDEIKEVNILLKDSLEHNILEEASEEEDEE